MGAKILLHFSKETLTNFPRIIKGYVAAASAENNTGKGITASNPSESVETNLIPVEEVSSTAS